MWFCCFSKAALAFVKTVGQVCGFQFAIFWKMNPQYFQTETCTGLACSDNILDDASWGLPI